MDGDSWSAYEVPLGELRELYLLRVMTGATPRREVTLAQASYLYTATQRAADGLAALPFEIHVAQISDAFGLGPFVRISIQ